MLLPFWMGAGSTDTHDGGGDGLTRREADALRKHLRRVAEGRRKNERARERDERLLRQAVEKAYRNIVEGLPDPLPLIEAAQLPTMLSDGLAARVIDLDALSQDLAAVARLIEIMEANEEEDVEILLMAM